MHSVEQLLVSHLFRLIGYQDTLSPVNVCAKFNQISVFKIEWPETEIASNEEYIQFSIKQPEDAIKMYTQGCL